MYVGKQGQVRGVAGFYKSRTINDQWIHAEGPIKTFTLRGIKDSPPYLHDGRLLTLDDTVEFFNLVLGVQLTPREKAALVAFMRQLSQHSTAEPPPGAPPGPPMPRMVSASPTAKSP